MVGQQDHHVMLYLDLMVQTLQLLDLLLLVEVAVLVMDLLPRAIHHLITEVTQEVQVEVLQFG